MRHTLLLCALFACSSDPEVRFTPISTLQSPTDGVVLLADGRTAQAGMADQICTLDLEGADVLADVDPTPFHERLLDADGERSLLLSDMGLIRLPEGDVLAEEALHARLVDGGVRIVVAHEGLCAVSNGADAVAIPGTNCDVPVEITVDRASGTVFIADGAALTAVFSDGSFTRRDHIDAERVAWDAASGAVILTEGRTLSRLEADGTRSWSTELRGPVLDLEHSSQAGVVIALIEDPAGARLQVVDADSGDTVGEHPLPSEADVTLSESGDRLALATPDAVMFYEVRSDGRGLRLPEGEGGVGRWSGLGAAGVVAGLGMTILSD